MKRISKSWLGWGVGVLLTLISGLFALFGPLSGALERFSFDLPLPGHDTHAPTNAVMVYITDEDFTALGQKRGQPFNRALHAKLVQTLRSYGARLIVFDLLFSEPEPEGDRALLAVLRQRRDVVIGAKESNGDWLLPLDSYRSITGVGHAALLKDGDGGVRRFSPSKFAPDFSEVQSFPGAALQALGKSPPMADSRRYLHYYGPPQNLPHTTYAKALAGGPGTGFFFNKVVFVGRKNTIDVDTGNSDLHPTPFSRDGRTGNSPGVAIHAAAFLNLLHHEWFTRAPGWVTGLLLLMLAGGAAGVSRLSPLLAVLVGAVTAVVLIGTAFVLARTQHVWFPWAALLVPLSAGVLWTVIYNGYRSHLERQLLRQSIGKYLSPNRVTQLLQHPETLRQGGEMREVSLMFTDIAGFSKVSQRKHPDDLVKLLNSYYEQAISAVHAEDGVVMDLIGDSIFALWNAPELQPDHAERACRTSLALHANLLKFDQANDGAPLRTRVGIHRGTVCVGNVGSSHRFNYTAIGDAVNLASRLEGLNKQVGTDILATREVQRAVEKDLLTRPVGQFRFKGFDQVAEVHELLGPIAPEPAWLIEFRAALRHFQRRAWDAAEAGFRRVIATRPQVNGTGEAGDGPSEFYLKQIEYLRAHPPHAEWLGEVELREK